MGSSFGRNRNRIGWLPRAPLLLLTPITSNGKRRSREGLSYTSKHASETFLLPTSCRNKLLPARNDDESFSFSRPGSERWVLPPHTLNRPGRRSTGSLKHLFQSSPRHNPSLSTSSWPRRVW